MRNPSAPPGKNEATPSPPTVGIISLGCPKNLVDSEVMAGYLAQSGFGFTDEPEEAEVIIVNTCSFIAPAVEEAKQSLRAMARLKIAGTCRLLICAGCLPQREGRALGEEFPEVDAFLGIDEIPRIGEWVCQLLKTERPASTQTRMPTYLYDHTSPRLLSTPPWTAYVKIAEGCSHACSFCTIPSIRGRFRSRRPESIIKEVNALVGRGVKEIILIAQDTTAYGRDMETDLASLLRLLTRIEGLHWIRLMYAFPGEISDDLLEVMASSDKVCHYLDVPLQHAHPRLLRLMRRPGSGDEYLAMIARLRSVMSDIAIRSTFLVGFPGETEEEFQALLDFLARAQLDRVGAFIYYREAGTPAARLEGQIPAEVAEERYHRLMVAQQGICRERNLAWVGKRLEILVESAEKEGLVGRSFRDAPEIDGKVTLEKPPKGTYPLPGELITAEITAASEYDLVGRLVPADGEGARQHSAAKSRKI